MRRNAGATRASVRSRVTAETEPPLEMAQCHVREGLARVLRQEQIVAEIDRSAFPDLYAQSIEVMTTLRRTLELQKAGVTILHAADQAVRNTKGP
jgi:hypothetical protein